MQFKWKSLPKAVVLLTASSIAVKAMRVGAFFRPSHRLPQGRGWLGGRILLILAVVAARWLAAATPTQADSGGVGWSAPANISNTPTNSNHPAIVADSYGYVHVLWSEALGNDSGAQKESHLPGDTIMYKRWDGDAWSEANDILYVPDDPLAEFLAVTVDNTNRLHAVWTGLKNIYYSNAPSAKAGSARSWTTPLVVATDSARSSYESSIIADSENRLYILYATRGASAGVFCIRSRDGGSTWETPVALSQTLDANEFGFSNVRAIVDSSGRLHVTWQTFQEEGYGQAVYYSRSTNAGQIWTAPAQLRYRGPADTWVEWPSLVARGESELHIIYVNGTNKGRAQRISTDAGETWSQPFTILNDMEGINGFMAPVVDRSGGIHLIANMRTQATQMNGIYYARWLGTGWSSTQPVFADPRYETSDHYTAATVRLGNEIHVVWNDINAGEIWYIKGQISGVQALSPLPLPPDTDGLQTPTPSLVRAPAAISPTQSAVSIPEAAMRSSRFNNRPPGTKPALSPLLSSVAGGSIFVLAAFAWSLARRRRRPIH